MIRTLNGLGNAININTISAGDAIKLSDNSTNQTVNVDISKQPAKSSISDDDVFVLEDSSGNVRKITGSNMKFEIDTNFWTYSSPSLRPDNTSDNLLIGTASNPDSRKLIVDGTSEFKGTMYLKGPVGGVGYINLYDSNKSHHTTLQPQEDVNAIVTLPNLTDTLVGKITTDTLKNKTLKLPKISDTSADNNYIFAVSELTADRTVTLPVLGSDDTFVFEGHTQTLTNKTFGNSTAFYGVPSINATLRLNGGSGIPGIIDMYDIDGSHALSIRSPDNLAANRNLTLPDVTADDTLLSRTSTAVLSNKSFSDMPVCEIGLAVKQSDGSTSGNVRFWDKDNSNYIDLHIEDHAVSGNYNMYLPNDIDETVLIGSRNTQTMINKTVSTGSVWNGNAIDVAYGGSGLASYTNGDLIYADGVTSLAKLAIGADKRFLMSDGVKPIWDLGPTATNPLKFTDLDISLHGLSGFGTNHQIITTTGSQLQYSSTLNSVALSSCTGNVSQFTNDSAYLTSSTIATPLTTAQNFGTAATGSVAIGKSDQGLNLIGSKIYLDYLKPISINIISAIVSSDLISYDGSSGMNFGQKNVNAFNSNLHSNTVLNLSLTNSAYDITMSSTAGDITYTSPEHHFSGLIKTFGSSVFVGADNSAPNLEVAINHSTSSSPGSSFVVFYYNHGSTAQIGDIGQVGTSSVQYNETSDYRLKTDVEDFNDCLDIISKLKVKKYKFKSDVEAGIDLPFIGFLAHEVNEASDYFDTVVTGKKDEKAMWCKKCNSFNCSCGDDCGEMEMRNKHQGIDYGKFAPYTIGAIQELYQIIQKQQAVIDKLTRASSFKDFKS